MRIRLATEEDLPTLRKLVAHASQELADEFGTPRMDDLVFAAISYGVNSGDAVVVAEQLGEIVGWCARVQVPGLPIDFTEGIGTWVFEPFRKEKVGRDMRREADKRAKARGAKFVQGIVAKTNEAGLKSCLAEGYEIVGYQVRKAL